MPLDLLASGFRRQDDLQAYLQAASVIEFSIQAVTEGINAVGRVTIRIEAEDPVGENGLDRKVFSGHGADTDIIVAAAKAYMYALNRLIAARREAARLQEVNT